VSDIWDGKIVTVKNQCLHTVSYCVNWKINIRFNIAEVNPQTLVTPPPVGELQCIVVSVCPSVREHISGTTRSVFTKFLCSLLLVVV